MLELMDISKEIPKPLVVVLRLQCTRARMRSLKRTIQAVGVSAGSLGVDSGSVGAGDASCGSVVGSAAGVGAFEIQVLRA